MNWTEQQSAALKAVEQWYKSKPRKQVFRIFGYAGVGKTSLARHFAQSIKGTVLYAAYTGKAALMMRNNGCTNAATIHSLIYKPEDNDLVGVTFNVNLSSPLRKAALLVIDECSMVDANIAEDILAFNVPVLVLGDPAQLPPVSGAGYFTNAEPDVMLTEIHRQAKDNPIVYLANRVREGGRLDVGTYGDSVVASDIETADDLLKYDQVIVGRNATRDGLNSMMRTMLGKTSVLPMVDDRLICLRNEKKMGIFNGEMFRVAGIEKPKTQAPSFYNRYSLTDMDGRRVLAKVHNGFFDGSGVPDWKYRKGSQEFDFGYAITAHKSQGIQWNDVVIIDESWCFRNDASRWLYTAITRAQNKILVYKT
jgi:exodeoxyribonuclease-5